MEVKIAVRLNRPLSLIYSDRILCLNWPNDIRPCFSLMLGESLPVLP